MLFSVIFGALNPRNEIFLCKNMSADLFKLSDLIKLAQKLMNLFWVFIRDFVWGFLKFSQLTKLPLTVGGRSTSRGSDGYLINQ